MEEGDLTSGKWVEGFQAKTEISLHYVELISTEKKYVSHLKNILEWYINPLKELRIEGVTTENMHFLFGDIPTMVEFHERFLVELSDSFESYAKAVAEHEKSDSKKPEPLWRIGKLFLTNIESFRRYQNYISSFAVRTDVLAKHRIRVPAFSEFIENVEEDPKSHGLSLDSLLIMPVQRLPRLALLLRDIIKCTDERDIERDHLEKALSELETLVELCNEKKREAEGHSGVGRIQEEIRARVRPHRALIMQSSHVQRYKEKDGSLVPKSAKYNLFLYTDLLLCKRKTVLTKKNRIIDLGLCRFMRSVASMFPDVDEAQNIFRIENISETEPLVLYIRPPAEEYTRWVRAIEKQRGQFMRTSSFRRQMRSATLSIVENPIHAHEEGKDGGKQVDVSKLDFY
eukprot:TRINITY_DN10301_c0_g1_i1.p1 TRINITY_DN10301_c0_g1~~TRINITY_DN10301_c0_g1_i1.p1  ORF type:complete len:400 (-),score=110.08 TRINITY_DN10301_c0_g1_i1:172-1371(-)